MVNINDIYGGEFLNAKIVTSEKIWRKPLTIKHTEVVTFNKDDPDKAEMKIVVSLEETEYKLVLNKTNAKTLGELFGEESNDWDGHKIMFQKGKTTFGDSIQIDDTYDEEIVETLKVK
jgi:hypothetical protein